MFLNTSPPNSGLPKTYSPCTIITGKAIDWNKSYKLHFGSYAQVHKEVNITNTLEERTQRAICLGPTDNLQGTYNFFSLHYGKKITCVQFTEVPTPTIVIKQVASMALAEKQNKGQILKNCTGTAVNDILPDDEANEAFKEIDGNITGVDWEVEIKEPAAHIPQLNINQYVELSAKEDDEEHDTKSTGVENAGEITDVRNDNKITRVDSNNKSTESGST